MRKKRILSLALASAMCLGLLSGCGSSPGGADIVPGVEGKILNIYVWNDEFQGKFNDNYPEVEKLSSDKSITYLKDGTEIHWILNPNQDGVYQQKLDEALLKQDRVAAAARDWAACPSPQSFFWGGTWLVAAQGSDNPEHVKDIMLKMTADRDILGSLAVNNGEMSNDQPLMEELAQSPDFGIELLGGQNYLGVLSEVAANIDLSNISSYDQGCVEEFQNTFGDYFNNKISLTRPRPTLRCPSPSAIPGWWAAAWSGRKRPGPRD